MWSDKDNSIEAIFEIQTSSDKTYGLGNSLPVVTGSRDDSGWAWGGPTSNLQKAFEAQMMINGERLLLWFLGKLSLVNLIIIRIT